MLNFFVRMVRLDGNVFLKFTNMRDIICHVMNYMN